MLGRTFAYFVLIAGAMTLPQTFVLDMGSVDSAVMDPSPAPLLNTTTGPFNWPTPLQTTSAPTTTPTPVQIPVSNSSIAAASNSTSTCLPATAIIITLPNPTPTPPSSSSHTSEIDTLLDDGPHATPFDTATPEPLSGWPHWFTAATFTLVFYDVITLGIFLWLWVFGYLWWFRRGNDRSRGAWGRRGRVREVEMSRTDVSARYDEGGRYEREWLGATSYGRVRSESEQRSRSAREAELEGEMRRLGMI